MLFDQDIERTRSDGKRHDEGDFDCLNVSGRPEAAAGRELLELWLVDYPSAHRTELIQRLRNSDQQFASASFELFLYTVLARLRWTIDVHPDIPGGNSKRPDFRVRTDSGDAFYLEATIAGAFSAAELAAEQRKKEVLHAIDDLHSPHFLLNVQVEGNPPTPVPRRKLRRQLRKWLESLVPQDVEKQIRGERHWEEHQYEHDGWIIRFRAIPRAKPAEAGRRTIGAWSLGVRTVNIVEAVKDAAKGKASRYGALDLPFVVAINVEEEFADSSQERDALFGDVQYWIPRDPEQGEVRPVRIRNGVWNGPRGPQCTHLSGVWLFRRFDPWHFVARESHLLYLNPWAARPVSASALRFPHAAVEGTRLVEHPGLRVRELFDLYEEWPEPAPRAA
ncbi:hypothetical protein [Bordetella genomosp. 10]|uniref:hypothetical protein n=1 Tax=Bordetella genomosp. 10 TaxID=1416804 RepID=UPI0011778AA2|nr:hypothetical protein [Bordetella genomosp. 10]